MRSTIVLIIAFLLVGCMPELPKDKALTRFVYDYDHLFTPAEDRSLDSLLAAYEKRTTNEIIVVTASDTTSDTSFYKVVRHLYDSLGVGKVFKNNGLVLAFSVEAGLTFTLYESNMVKDTADWSDIQDSTLLPLLSEGRYYDAFHEGALRYMALADSIAARKARKRAARKSS